jgi:quinol monooxygenase YgiN
MAVDGGGPHVHQGRLASSEDRDDSLRSQCRVEALLGRCGTEMLIASLMFDVRPDKRAEFVSAVGDILDTLRSSRGCLGCRLVSDCENENVFVMTSEWNDGTSLEQHLASSEFQILEGTRILLRDGPSLSVDEVLSRRRAPRPRRRQS